MSRLVQTVQGSIIVSPSCDCEGLRMLSGPICASVCITYAEPPVFLPPLIRPLIDLMEQPPLPVCTASQYVFVYLSCVGCLVGR